MIKRFEEAMDTFIQGYKYRNKLLEEDDVNLDVFAYPIGDKYKFYLIQYGSAAVGSIFTSNDTTIISEYTDGKGINTEN